MKKTQEEINIMVLALEKQREALPQFTMFGDDNHLVIDAQIDVLKGNLRTEADISDHLADEDEDKKDQYESDISNALYWLQGQTDDESLCDDEHIEAAKKEYPTSSKINVCAKQCNECPFSKNALPGWLADYSVDNIQDYMNHEALFPCHMMMKGDDMNQQEVQQAITEGKLKLCRGYVECIIKSGKMPYKNKTLVQAVKDAKAQGVGENSMDIFQFRQHHTKLTKK